MLLERLGCWWFGRATQAGGTGLITGSAVSEAFEKWLADAAYKDRTD